MSRFLWFTVYTAELMSLSVIRYVMMKLIYYRAAPSRIDDQIWNAYSFQTAVLQDVTLNTNRRRREYYLSSS